MEERVESTFQPKKIFQWSTIARKDAKHSLYRQRQIRTTVRKLFIPTSMAVVKRTDNDKC